MEISAYFSVTLGVAKKTNIPLDFIVDKLTNSIENVFTGDSFRTEVSTLSSVDLKAISKKSGWVFDWRYEFRQPEREVYKLTIAASTGVIQGLISLEIKDDHVYMHLLESAPFNKGKEKVYEGVPGNLVAFACRLSFQRGFEGNLAFVAKSALVEHYEKTLGAIHFRGRLMVINKAAALALVDRYFKT